jgi:hypothetical protein
MEGYKMTEVVESGKYLLYNLNKDPYETDEISSKYPKIIEKLKIRLELWKLETRYETPLPNSEYKG